MNPLTQVKNLQRITAREAAAGISEQGSWHEKYKDSAYINIGLLPFDLTEGDLLAIFAQYGEVVDVNLVRDKATGKSRGFAFLAYEDQRSTVLAVDNLNGAQVVGRTIRVDHVANYKKKVEEDEEEEQRKREERGVCYAFQRGECNRGDACKYSHDLQRNANTGWGKKDDGPSWRRDKTGRSPPPPPWKQGNGSKDNPPNPPPWRTSSGQKDDPPPSRDRKENGSSYAPQTKDESRQQSAQLPRRYEDRTKEDGPPSSSRQGPSRMDDYPVRARDGSELSRPSRRYDDDKPAKRDTGSDSRRDPGHRDASPDFRRHSTRRDNQSSSLNEAEDLSTRRSGKRRDDSPPRRRHDSHSEDDSLPQSRPAKRRADRDDASPSAYPDRVQDGTRTRVDDRVAPGRGNRRDSSPRQKADKYSRDGDSSPRRRYRSRSPKLNQRSSGTRR
ncbi:unnamed protein product [Calypogeia fissa]